MIGRGKGGRWRRGGMREGRGGGVDEAGWREKEEEREGEKRRITRVG